MDPDQLNLLDNLITKRNAGELTSQEEAQLSQLIELLFSTPPEVISAEIKLATAGSIDAALTQELTLQLEGNQKILQEIENRNKSLSDQHKFLINRRLNQILQQNILKNISQKKLQQIRENTSDKPDSDPIIVNQQAAADIVAITVAQLEQQANLKFAADEQNTAQQRRQLAIDTAAAIVTQELATGIAQNANEAELSAMVALATASEEVRNLDEIKPVYELTRKLETDIKSAETEDYIKALDPEFEKNTIIDPITGAKVKVSVLNDLATPFTQPKSSIYTLPQGSQTPEEHTSSLPTNQDKLKNAFTKADAVNQTAVSQIKVLGLNATTIAEERKMALTIEHEVIKNNKDLLPVPTPASARAAGIFQAAGFSPALVAAVKLTGRGATPEQVDGALSGLKPAERAKISGFSYNTHSFMRLIQNSQNFHAEISSLTKASPLGQTINQLSTRFGPAAGNILRIAGNPGGALQSWAMEQAGKKIGTALGQQLLKHGMEQAGNALIKQGLKEGLKTIGTQLLSKAGISLGAIGAEAATGIGIPLAIIHAALAVAGLLWDLVGKNALNSLWRSVFGHNFEKEDAAALAGAAVAAPLAGLAIISGTAMAILSAVSITFLSPVIFAIIIGSVVFFYIPTINIAPLLSTIVHLESGLGVGGAPGGATQNVNCVTFTSAWDANPQGKAKVESIIDFLKGSYPNFMKRVCLGNSPLTIDTASTTDPFLGYAPKAQNGTYLMLYTQALTQDDASLAYTVIHELGHIINWRDNKIFDQYITDVACQPGQSGCDNSLPGYPFAEYAGDTEEFADTAAWYGAFALYGTPRYDLANFPRHLDFAKNVLFGQGPPSASTPTGGPEVCELPGPFGPSFTPALTGLKEPSGRSIQVATSVVNDMKKFITAAQKTSYNIAITEGYRTYERQHELCVAYFTGASPYIAAPSAFGLHRTGKAADMYILTGTGGIANLPPELVRIANSFGFTQPIPGTDPPHFEHP